MQHSKALTRWLRASAFAFCTRIKDYRVLRKESKTLGRDILYIGFPQSTLDKVLSKQMFTRVDEKTVRVPLQIDQDKFWNTVTSRLSKH